MTEIVILNCFGAQLYTRSFDTTDKNVDDFRTISAIFCDVIDHAKLHAESLSFISALKIMRTYRKNSLNFRTIFSISLTFFSAPSKFSEIFARILL